MKRTQDKIKDFVEPQAYEEVRDFAADPARALAAYRFTDATSDLLARWLDALADLPRGRGAAHALAGLRGVGKSHALAAFGALVGSPPLRATVPDAHVAASARRLSGRRHTVVRVERGTRPAFAEELGDAFARAFGGDAPEWSSLAPAEALARAVEEAQGATVALLVDTAYGRAARVARDDGPALSALAEAAASRDAFVALALDDDIAGAEGANVALSQTFRIDYLEPEHLYHVADSYLLRKSPPARDRLHEIYLQLRAAVPNFNWSEPRFAALYPVHPLVADVAAAVRLHAHSFAFLPFAASSSGRAVNRPALSLILLDEVFDQTERELRQTKELEDAFRVFDELATKAVAQFPALQRLHVRLVLKNLFVLSLDGRGATARDLCAALLLEESDAQPQVARVEETLARLAELAPAGGLVKTADDGEDCYRFHLGAASGLDAALARALKRPLADPSALNDLLAGLARARFEDWPLAAHPAGPAASQDAPDGRANSPHQESPFAVVWRGSLRRGRILALRAGGGGATPAGAPDEDEEWRLLLLEPGADAADSAGQFFAAGAPGQPLPRGDEAGEAHDAGAGRPREAGPRGHLAPVPVVWQPAELTAEEWGLLRRLHALKNDPTLAPFGDAARVAANSLAARAERVWARLYLDDGALVIGGERHGFTAESRADRTLAGALGRALAAHFDALHPRHPEFAATLCEQDVSRLVENFFSGANAADPEVQRLAAEFAEPLGLAAVRNGLYAPAVGDGSAGRPWAQEVLALVAAAGEATVPEREVCRALSRPPSGLTAEARQLVMAALVAARRVELVTRADDRISRRTLGRAVNWSKVAGVCRPAGVRMGAEELTAWARRLTGREDLPVVNNDSAYEIARAALAGWLRDWRANTALRDFDELPDAGLTTRTWKLAAGVRAAFESAADAVASAETNDLALEEVLQRVADAFGSSAEEFGRAASQLESLAAYASGLAARERARAYLTAAEPTGVGEIESARRELLTIAEDPHALLEAPSRERFDLLWQAFRERYGAHYRGAHERAAGPAAAHRREVEEFTRSDQWRELEALASLPVLSPSPWREASALAARALSAGCAQPVERLLEERPRCVCGFRLSETEELAGAPARLAELTAGALASYRRTLAPLARHLADALPLAAADSASPDVVACADSLANSLSRGLVPPQLSADDCALIARSLEQHPAPQLLHVEPPPAAGLLAREELAARVGRWLEELPHGPALVSVEDRTAPNAAAETPG
jgi:hypothetical protein